MRAPSPRRVFAQIHRIHRAFETDVQERDVAFGEGHDGDAGEREALEEACGVFLIAAEAIERLGEDDVDLLAERHRHHCLETRTHQRCAGHRMVRILAIDLPALPLGELTTDADLVSDRGVPLVLGRVAGVDGNLHAGPRSRVDRRKPLATRGRRSRERPDAPAVSPTPEARHRAAHPIARPHRLQRRSLSVATRAARRAYSCVAIVSA